MTVELKLMQSQGLECVIHVPGSPDVTGKLQIQEASKYVPQMFFVTVGGKYLVTIVRFFESDVEKLSEGSQRLYIKLKN